MVDFITMIVVDLTPSHVSCIVCWFELGLSLLWVGIFLPTTPGASAARVVC